MIYDHNKIANDSERSATKPPMQCGLEAVDAMQTNYKHELGNEQMTNALLLYLLEQWLYAPVMVDRLAATTREVLELARKVGRL